MGVPASVHLLRSNGTVLPAEVPRNDHIHEPLPMSELRHLVDTANVTPKMDQPATWLSVQQ